MAEVIRYVDPDALGGGTGIDWANAYTSLSAWESSEQTDLVSAGDWHHVFCRASSGSADTTALVVAGWTTDSNHYILIEAETGDEAVKNGWDISRYRLSVTDIRAIDNQQSNVELKLLQIEYVFSTVDFSYVVFDNTADLIVNSCRIRVLGNSNNNISGLHFFGISTSNVFNTIIENAGRGIRSVSANNINIYNSIVYNSADFGIIDSGVATIVSKNNAVFLSGDDFNLTGTNTIDYCASDDGDGINPQAPSGGDWLNEFIDPANGDFTAVATGNIQFGVGPSADSNVPILDIEGDTRSGATAFIGVDEPDGTSQEVILNPIINEPETIIAQLLSAKIISANITESETITASLLSGKSILATINESESITSQLLIDKIISAVVNEPENITATLLTESTVDEVVLTPIVNESEDVTALLLSAKELFPTINEPEIITATLKNRLPLFPEISESENITATLLVSSPTTGTMKIFMVMSKDEISAVMTKPEISMNIKIPEITMELKA